MIGFLSFKTQHHQLRYLQKVTCRDFLLPKRSMSQKKKELKNKYLLSQLQSPMKIDKLVKNNCLISSTKFQESKTSCQLSSCFKISLRQWRGSSLLWRVNWWPLGNLISQWGDSLSEITSVLITWKEKAWDLVASKAYWDDQAQMLCFLMTSETNKINPVKQLIRTTLSTESSSAKARRTLEIAKWI